MGSLNILAPLERAYSFPYLNAVIGDNHHRWRMLSALAVTEITALKIGGGVGTFDYEIRHSVNADDQGAGTLIHSVAGVSNNTTGDVDTPPGDFPAITIPAGDWVWVEITGATTGINRVVAANVYLVGLEA